MGSSLITSEAENFLIWLLSICNLSFVDFLFIPLSLPLSFSTSFPQTFSKTVLSFYLPDPVQGPWWTWGQDTAKDSAHLGDTLPQGTTGQSVTARRQPHVTFKNYGEIYRMQHTLS